MANSNPLTKAQLIKALKPYPDNHPVIVHNQAGLPLTYAVTGVMGDQDFNVAHLFDQSIEPPESAAIYLLIKIEPG